MTHYRALHFAMNILKHPSSIMSCDFILINYPERNRQNSNVSSQDLIIAILGHIFDT